MTTTPTTINPTKSADPAVEGQVVLLDPRALSAHPSNVRRDLRDLRGMVRSIKAVGVLVPLVVVPTSDGDGYQIVAGHRRCQAAIEAGIDEVPCLVRSDLDDARQVAAMLVENTQREGISGAEEAAGYEQLAVLGLSDARIAKATGATRKHVEKARRVAASETATTVAGRYDLTLDQALVIAEFDDDRDTVKELAATAVKDPGRFEHLASRRRQDRARSAQRTATAQALQDAGVQVLSEDERYNDHPRGAHLTDLVDSEGTPLTAQNHAGCPGHSAVVKEWEPTEATYYCLEPAKYGHRSRYSRNGRTTGKMTDEQKAQRRQVIENNKAWKAAEPVRQAFVRQLLSAKKPPTGVLRYAVTEVLTDPDRVGDGRDELLAELTGVETAVSYGRQVGREYAAKLTDARLPLGLLAQVAADNEHLLGISTWRQRDARAARWLSFLASVGYDLSAIEQHVIDQTQPEVGNNDGNSPPDTETPLDSDVPGLVAEAEPIGDTGSTATAHQLAVHQSSPDDDRTIDADGSHLKAVIEGDAEIIPIRRPASATVGDPDGRAPSDSAERDGADDAS